MKKKERVIGEVIKKLEKNKEKMEVLIIKKVIIEKLRKVMKDWEKKLRIDKLRKLGKEKMMEKKKKKEEGGRNVGKLGEGLDKLWRKEKFYGEWGRVERKLRMDEIIGLGFKR